MEALLQRLSDGILPDDRREALAQLRDLLTASHEARTPTVVVPCAQHHPRERGCRRQAAPRRLQAEPDTSDRAGACGARQCWHAGAVRRAAGRARRLGHGPRCAGVPGAGGAARACARQQRACPAPRPAGLQASTLVASDKRGCGTQRKSGRPSPGAFNAELLVRVPGALALVLGLLQGGSGGDFYVAYHTVQLLTALGMGNMPRLLEVRRAAAAGQRARRVRERMLCDPTCSGLAAHAGSAGGTGRHRAPDGPAGQ